MDNLVSIITPCYNSELYIEDCINSVLAQSYDKWEMIIVDDFSSDGSMEKIMLLSDFDSRIRIIKLEENHGAAIARNIALKDAKGSFIAFLDADDFWEPLKLESQINFMIKNNIAFSFTSYTITSKFGDITNKIVKAPKEMSYKSYLKNTIIGCLTVVINRKITGSFQFPKIKSSHDMALWLEIMKRGYNAYGMYTSYANYRIVSTSNTANKLHAAIDVWRVYRNIENLSILYSLFCFINYTINAFKKRLK